jgi:phosphatidylserine/phosphatidylglycerophosphate/cardiolipin synthase-like enzyme
MAFSFTNDRLGSAMLEMAGQGVGLQGIFETRGSETDFGELSRLACAGYEMRQDGNPGALHHKVIVIDGRIVVTGSLNFSDNANQSNDENVMIIENPQIADRYLQEFSRRWREAAPPDSSVLNCNPLP